MKISNKVEGCEMISLDSLENFQPKGFKKMPPKGWEKLKASLMGGVTSPLFVWGDKLMDGHHRVAALKELRRDGHTLEGDKVPVVRIQAKDEKEAGQIVLQFNSKYSRITKEGLRKFLDEFTITELGTIDIPEFDIDIQSTNEDEVKPEVEFSEELMESNNYIVLTFRTDIDWLNAQTILGIKQVKSPDSKPGYQRFGIGRVLDGAKALEKLTKEK